MDALDALLMQEWEKEVWRSYQAEAMRTALKLVGGRDVRRYEELIAAPGQEMTPEQVAQQRRRLLDGLRGD